MATNASHCVAPFVDDFGATMYPMLLSYSSYLARYYFFLEGV